MTKKLLIFSVALLILQACTSSPRPYKSSHDGQYYMVGDSNCRYWRGTGPSTILCLKSDKKTTTGYRAAMTPADLQMYLYQQQQQQVAMQNLLNSLDNFNRQLQQQTSYNLNQANFNNQNYNWAQPRQKKISRCQQVGSFIQCL